ncbi:hypothetical protein BO221_24380 [Archangium sp. Cb G35]|nr:hypothetical protein BO221_24380 [Archangium sp. Cb G35]
MGGAVLGVLWFLVVGGLRTLDPSDLDWVGDGDLAQHVLGWMHFRNAPWGLPLGRTPDLMTPLTMTVGFADSNPWVSVLLKPFSRWLPQDFQFIGPWFALCFALQGWMGARLTGLFTPRPLDQLLGAALFAMAPVLLYRTGHDTLCAQWMILALLYLNLRPREDARRTWNALGWAAGVNVLASGVHPYLEVMVFALTLALLLSGVREHHLSRRSAAVVLGGLAVTVIGLFLLFGYVGQDVTASAAGFGAFSADTLTLFNAMGWTRWGVPSLNQGPGQYEGFGYLGTGVLALAGVTLAWRPSAWWPRVKAALRTHAPLMGAVLLMTLLAFSTVVTVSGWTVISIRGLTQPLQPLLAPFRSSGRFIWPLHYLVTTGVVALALWRWRASPRVATGLLLATVVLQAVETPAAWSRDRFEGVAWPRLRAPEWEQVDPFYRHIVLYPPDIRISVMPCVLNTFPASAYVSFGDLAYRKHLTTNSGYSARLNEQKVDEVCQALRADVNAGRLSPDTLYVVDRREDETFRRLGEQVTCGTLDDFRVCVTAREGTFREALAKQVSAEPGRAGHRTR